MLIFIFTTRTDFSSDVNFCLAVCIFYFIFFSTTLESFFSRNEPANGTRVLDDIIRRLSRRPVDRQPRFSLLLLVWSFFYYVFFLYFPTRSNSAPNRRPETATAAELGVTTHNTIVTGV